MESAINELWETIMQTCPILMKEWLSCFNGDQDAARCEINETLSDTEKWSEQNCNFLLRLVSDDKNGYRDASGNYKPRVQLALAFVRHMSRSACFTDFVVATLNVYGNATTLEYFRNRLVYTNNQL